MDLVLGKNKAYFKAHGSLELVRKIPIFSLHVGFGLGG